MLTPPYDATLHVLSDVVLILLVEYEIWDTHSPKLLVDRSYHMHGARSEWSVCDWILNVVNNASMAEENFSVHVAPRKKLRKHQRILRSTVSCPNFNIEYSKQHQLNV